MTVFARIRTGFDAMVTEGWFILREHSKLGFMYFAGALTVGGTRWVSTPEDATTFLNRQAARDARKELSSEYAPMYVVGYA